MIIDNPEELKLKILFREVNEIYVEHPRLTYIFNSIAFAHEHSADCAEPECFIVTGNPGVGKSEIIRVYCQNYKRQETANGVIIPVLYAIVPKPTTIKNFASTLLRSLGDPFPEKGTTTQISSRLAQLIKECGVQIILLDEFQHLAESADPDISADWLKVLIETTRVPVGLFGLPNSVEILNVNEQLDSRFANRIVLQPFTWFDQAADEKSLNHMRQDFKSFLGTLDKELPFPQSSSLSSEDLAPRLYYASDGITRPLMRLIRRAAYLVLLGRRDFIELQDLKESYNLVLASRFPDKLNPFNIEFDANILESNAYLDHLKTLHKPRNGFNNRINKRKRRKETFLQAIS